MSQYSNIPVLLTSFAFTDSLSVAIDYQFQ